MHLAKPVPAFFLCAALGAVALVSAPRPSVASPDGNWIFEVPPAGPAPGARRDYCAILDAPGQRAVYFGGYSQLGALGDTWGLTLGAPPTWLPMGGAGLAPTPRYGHSGVFDAAGDRLVIFGGYDVNYRNDVRALTLDSSPTWTTLWQASGGPSGRMYHSAIYDPPRNRMVVFGGHPSFLNDLWAFSLTGTPAWTALSPGGPPPSPRWGHAAVYDPLRDRMLVFGGVLATNATSNELWSLNLAGPPQWTQLAPAGPLPPGRQNFSMSYDPLYDRLLVFGGANETQGLLLDVWELPLGGPLAWHQLHPTGGPPAPRDLFTGVLHPSGQKLVVYGGWLGGSFLGDIWYLQWDASTPVLASVAAVNVAPDRVSLTWFAAEPPAGPCAVVRREGVGAWSERATLAFDGAGRLSYEDRDVRAGASYTYGLIAPGDTEPSALYEVEVPRGAALSLAGLARNPSRSNLAIRFSLPDGAPATLEAMDVAGRVVFRSEVGSLGAGSHLVDGGQAAPGIYWIRLTRGAQALTARGAVVR